MADTRVQIIEDEEDIVELLRYNIRKSGHETFVAMTGEEGIESVRRNKPNLVLLDLMLPGVNGLEVCKVLKSNDDTKNIPIIMVSAKGEENDIVTGLEMGADDYITKPFSPKILLARVEAVLRRGRTSDDVDPAAPLEVHGIWIHPGKCEVKINERMVDLSRTEFQVLHLLMRRRGWVFTRSQIVEEVQGPNYPVTDRAVDVQIVGLRKKLGELGELIETVRGVGYRFKE